MATVVVVNPGTHPELAWGAAGLLEAGHRVRYATSMTFGLGAGGRLPPALRRVHDRRRLVAPVPDAVLHRSGVGLELLRLAVRPRTNRWDTPLIRWRNARVARAATRLLDGADAAVVIADAGGLPVLREASRRGIPTVLANPLVQPQWAIDYLAEEAAANPTWAPTLQAHEELRWRLDELAEEVELATAVCVLSTFAASTYGGRAGSLHVTNLGIEADLFTPPAAPRDDDRFRVLFTGQLTQRKGISYLVDAVAEAGLASSSELVFVGPSVGGADRLLAERGASVYPAVPRIALPAVLATADAYVLPSLVEGFPMSALEAMACGVPTVVTTHTFGSDVITNGVDGFVVPPRDVAGLAATLRTLHEDREARAAMGRAGRARAEAQTWARYQAQLGAVVDAILAG